MKRNTILALGILFIFSMGGPATAADVNGPRIVVEEPEFDFQTVKEGAVVTHTFHVLNRGNEPLRILSVRPG